MKTKYDKSPYFLLDSLCQLWNSYRVLSTPLSIPSTPLSSPVAVAHINPLLPTPSILRKVELQGKVLIKKFGYFLSMSQQAVSADIIPNSAVGIFSPKTEGTKT
jgi:hypothetical protein